LSESLQNWRETLPLAGMAVLACAGLFFLFRKKPEDTTDLERERRAYLNRVGRIVEGQLLEFADHMYGVQDGAPGKVGLTSAVKDVAEKVGKKSAKQVSGSGVFAASSSPAGAIQNLIYYTYSISGVTYETAQDITGLEERLHLSRIAAGQAASVKYDPSNPSNSILLADDWSGLH
jgi:hypothetical protein